MSKELTPLEALERLTRIHNHDEFKECYNIIEDTLKEYQRIINEKPIYISLKGKITDKATELVKELNKKIKEPNIIFIEVQDDENEEKLKAFEIIKEKEVNIQNFKITCATMSYKQYLFMWKDGCFMGVRLVSKTMLTQEEYDLLKEVLL